MIRTPHTLSKATRLRALLESPQLEFLMEAHNGISARIVEEAGFKGIWASGLALSAQFGVRDNNEASWTQVLEMLEFMADATTVPVLLDGDTGYGNFNNVRRLVRKLEQRAVAGVCIEDKQFPKTNSFIAGERRPLADIKEFCGKIKAGKDSLRDPAFCIVARVEALIAGWGLDEALKRAEAYRRAGADAILIHSKRPQADEILSFACEWAGRAPLVVVPTTYYSTPTAVFRNAGIGVVIWANHMLRAAVPAMQAVAQEIHATQSVANVEDRVAPVSELFRLQGAEELEAAQRVYAAPGHPPPRALVLAANRGEGLEALTEERPKAMLPVAGKPLLRRLVDSFKKQGIHDIAVVAGYKAETIELPSVKILINPDHTDSGELVSLSVAADRLDGDLVLTYGDLLFRRYILRDLLESHGEIVVVVDSAFDRTAGAARDLAYCSAPDEHGLFRQHVALKHILPVEVPEKTGSVEPPSGRWIGMLRARAAGMRLLREALDTLRARPDFVRLSVPDLLNHVVASGHLIEVLYIHGHWLDVNDLHDFRRAGDFAHGEGTHATRLP